MLGAHPAGLRGGIAAEADGLADFPELARVVVPVTVSYTHLTLPTIYSV